LMNIVGVLVAKPIASKIGKKNTYLGAMAMSAIFSLFFYNLDKTGMTMVFILQTIISIGAGMVLPLLWSMYADTADYSEWKTGRRATGLVFSASSMSQKFGWAIGGSLVGFMLGFYGFQANVVQTDRALFGMRLMLSIFPAIGAGLSALFMAIYPLGESKVHKITEELTERRSGTPQV
jgi:glycoside/pentoside/hexuronide:cation symporter, GPH family